MRFIFGNKLYKIYIATAVYYLVILFPTLCLVNTESKIFTCYSKYNKHLKDKVCFCYLNRRNNYIIKRHTYYLI